MHVILIQDVPSLGKAGETKNVRPGYGRNYLLAKGLAVLPGDVKAKEVLTLKSEQKREEAAKKSQIEKNATEINGKEFTFKVKVDKKDNLYGSIGPKEIAQATGVEESTINTHFKKIGIFPLTIDFGKGITANIKIELKKEL